MDKTRNPGDLDVTNDIPLQPQPVQTPPPGYFTAEQVEAFRRQERDKLYPDLRKRDEAIEELRQKLASLEAEREEARKAEEERRKAEEEAARRKAEEEMSVRQLLQQREQEWNERFAALEAEREAERAALQKERELAALQAHIQRRVREEAEAKTIAPELLDLVNGNSVEEVERSIQLLQEKTQAIVAGMQAAQAQAAPPAPPRGVSPAGYAATGPMDMHSEQRIVTPEEIRNMPMDEYREFRKQLGLGGNSRNNQGLFF